MSTAEEFRQYERECLQSALAATTDQDRQAFLDMARTWERAAVQLEGGIGLPPTAPITAAARYHAEMPWPFYAIWAFALIAGRAALASMVLS